MKEREPIEEPKQQQLPSEHNDAREYFPLIEKSMPSPKEMFESLVREKEENPLYDRFVEDKEFGTQATIWMVAHGYCMFNNFSNTMSPQYEKWLDTAYANWENLESEGYKDYLHRKEIINDGRVICLLKNLDTIISPYYDYNEWQRIFFVFPKIETESIIKGRKELYELIQQPENFSIFEERLVENWKPPFMTEEEKKSLYQMSVLFFSLLRKKDKGGKYKYSEHDLWG